jgi:hypothetical protein
VREMSIIRHTHTLTHIHTHTPTWEVRGTGVREMSMISSSHTGGKPIYLYSIIIGVVSVYMQYNCVYYCDT